MRPILAIAAITIRTAIRSKIVVSLLAILMAIIVLLPLTVKGDGTLGGQVQIIIGYTLGIAGTLLAMATLWAGCAAVSSEIQEKQIQMLVAKPVRRGEIWMGKWLGLMAMNALLLSASVGATYGLLHWRLRPSQLSEADQARLKHEVFVARSEVKMQMPDVEEQTRAQFEDMKKKGALPANADPEDVLTAIRQNFQNLAGAVPPGNARSWPITLPAGISEDAELTVRFKFAISSVDRNPVAGMWLAGPPSNRELLRLPQTNAPMAFHEVRIPARVLGGGTELLLSYANFAENGATVVFAGTDAITVLFPISGFGVNFLRGALVVFAQLAFLTALGVTAGTMFSLPVAGLLSLVTLMLLLSSGFLTELSEAKHLFSNWKNASALLEFANDALRMMYKAMNAVIRPLDFSSPWDEIATARIVPWARVAKSFLVGGLLYGGLLAWFGTYVFNRREVALPQS